MVVQTVISKKNFEENNFLVVILLAKIPEVRGSADLDPYLNFMDPQYWLLGVASWTPCRRVVDTAGVVV
jgi:hypothetical protein